MPPSPSKKRKKSATATTPIQISNSSNGPSTAQQVALPPPLIPYPPHLMPSYFPVYHPHQHPYFLSVGPQPPVSPSLSPTSTAPNQQRILPKSPSTTSSSNPAISPSALTPSYNFYPYPMQLSPQLHPAVPPGAYARHNSVSSLSSTADQREQARKVSHSAIERRRRERINDKIMQLKDLIPSCSDRDNLHKMTILQSAIDYIVYLKSLVDDNTTIINNNKEDISSKINTALLDPLQSSKKSQNGEEQEDEEGEDAWSVSSASSPSLATSQTKNTSPVTPLPSSGLKPMDIIKAHQDTCSPPPPKIIVVDNSPPDELSSNNVSTDRNMNLENLLC